MEARYLGNSLMFFALLIFLFCMYIKHKDLFYLSGASLSLAVVLERFAVIPIVQILIVMFYAISLYCVYKRMKSFNALTMAEALIFYFLISAMLDFLEKTNILMIYIAGCVLNCLCVGCFVYFLKTWKLDFNVAGIKIKEKEC